MPRRFSSRSTRACTRRVTSAICWLGRLGENDFAIIFTRDHAIDSRILEHLLPRLELSYLGMIGSANKVERFKRRLEAKGIATPDRWARLRSPIGLRIGAESPAEIAISVLAELIRTRAEALVGSSCR
jgi:xanthine dehydrogenase accessory factor